MALAPWQDEVLLPAPGFSDAVPRYNVITADGAVALQGVQIVLQNIVDVMGTQVNAENVNLIIDAVNAAATQIANIISGAQKVGKASQADSATTATSATSATSAASATKATTADSATVAGNVTGVVAIAHGGTGATTVAKARANLGLGESAGALPVAYGGTGSTTAAAARTALGVAYGTTAGTVCQGNDSRLSNARTPTAHTQAASTITAGTFPGNVVATDQAVGTVGLRNIYAGTGDMTPGSTALATGRIYLMYE